MKKKIFLELYTVGETLINLQATNEKKITLYEMFKD